MSSLMWYIFDFARKAWADAFANAKNEPEISFSNSEQGILYWMWSMCVFMPFTECDKADS